MPRTILVLSLLFAAVATAGGAQNRADVSWQTYRIGDAPADLRLAIGRADLIILSLRSALLSELSRDLAEGGTEVALRACHIDTIAAAQRIGRDERVAVGRTSARLRNPANAPPPWAARVVQETAGQRAQSLDGFVVRRGDRVGVLRPIAEQRVCAGCHGPSDRLDAGTRRTLDALYPADRAVGYHEGDLRGWFWVDLPIGRR